MKMSLNRLLFLTTFLFCYMIAFSQNRTNNMITEKKDIGSLLALYPKPMTVIGAFVNDKPNWLVVGHTGIIGHDRILISMSKSHFTNQGMSPLEIVRFP